MRSLQYIGVMLATVVAVLAGGAAPAQALTACSVMTPCLPYNSGFFSVLPASDWALFTGTALATGALNGENTASGSSPFTAGVTGYLGTLTGSGSGVFGAVNSSSGANLAGVYGRLNMSSPGPNSAGVHGEVISGTNQAYGVWGAHSATSGVAAGVLGNTLSAAVNAVGVQGVILPTNAGAGSKAVWGYNAGTGANGYGVYGEQQGSGVGVFGNAMSGIGAVGTTTNQNGIGVVGYQPNGLAGAFVGNLAVTGTLTKGAGAFRIDHPLDPVNRYLQHSFVESPDMKNVYDGVTRTDRRGFATVRLPSYFAALNRSFRYQLTLLGKAAWGAQAVVWERIKGNRFVIRSKSRVEVSWQVTGIRKDRYANAHRIQPEIAKPASERNTYLTPELYGKPRSQAAFRLPVH
jgi:hypothetical protein